MPFDYLGTMTRAQYDALKSFAEEASADSAEIRDHLDSLVDRSDTFTAKILAAGHASGGTQITGFSGATYTNEDRTGSSVGEQTGEPPLPGINQTTPHPLITFLRSRRANRSSFGGSPLDFSQGSFSGGDLPWLDTPIMPQPTRPWGAFDDLHTAVIVAEVKKAVLLQIRTWREEMELRGKQGLDYREQLLMRYYDLTVYETKLELWLRQIEEQFEGAEPGLAIDDPDATTIPDDSELQGGLITQRETDGPNVLYTNLWESYPPTRVFPVWPLIAEDEKGADALDALDREYEQRYRDAQQQETR